MNEQEQRALDILAGLAGNPAVPFHEWSVADHILGVLATLDGVEYGRDDFGNIIARYTAPSIAALPESEREPPIAFVAHMDHPGYEIVRPADASVARSGGKSYIAQALGGVPAASMTQNTPAFVLMPDGERVPAEIRPLYSNMSDNADRQVSVHVQTDAELAMPAALVFDLPDFGIDGDTIRMRAADDLAGCGAILSALERLVHNNTPSPSGGRLGWGQPIDFIAVFTRAEEGGLFGARLMAEAGTLPANTLVVSVESSPLIPGVEQGKGPVIRTGDRVYTFDADAEQVFSAALQSLRATDSEFKAQRQLMSGGGCEATAFAVFGYTVTGLAFPLGNWHNATTTIPDPDGGVDSEYISVSDYLGGVTLMAEAGVSVGKRHDSPTRQYIRQIPYDVRERMRRTAGE